jgi:hypothetical protein
MTRIRITFSQVAVTATLDDSQSAQLLRDAIPFESTAKRWGDEVYFETPITTGEEQPQADVPAGTVAYWPPGRALCLFFGQKPYSPVNVVGRLEGDPAALADVMDDETVRVDVA